MMAIVDMASQMDDYGFFVIVWSRDCVIGLFHKIWIVIDVITYFRLFWEKIKAVIGVITSFINI